MKKTLMVLLAIITVMTVMVFSAVHSGAAETVPNGYIPIYTIEDLYNVRNNLTANYILMNDIDLTEATAAGGIYDDRGYGWKPLGDFKGIFDGNGYSIIGMRIRTNTTGRLSFGLFASISGGTVKNLGMEDGIITDAFSGYPQVGFIAGSASGKIENCFNTGDIDLIYLDCKNTASDQPSVGGLVGYGAGLTITSSYNTGKISTKISGATTSTYKYSTQYDWTYTGGIVGYGKTATVNNCYNTGEVIGTVAYSNNNGGSAGIGLYVNEINCCYNTGKVEWAVSKNATVKNCYYKKGCAYSNITGVTSLNDAQIFSQGAYSGFDFNSVWIMDTNALYPYPQLRNNPQNLNEAASLVSVLAYPTKTQYFAGDKLNLTGSLVRIVYKSGREEIVEISEDMVSGFNMNTVGEQTVTVSVAGMSDSFTINVIKRPAVLSIEFVSQPNIKEFTVGTKFDFTGAKAKITYEGDIVEYVDITPEMTTGGNINKIGKQTITYSFEGKSATFDVEVIAVKVEKIILTSLPNKLVYTEGEELDLTGMSITSVMSNGMEIAVNSGYTVSGFVSKYGTYSVTVTYSGATASFEVEVECAHLNKTVTNAKIANCQEGGWEQYFTCNQCDQMFASNGTTKITNIPYTSVNKDNHTNERGFQATTATCTQMGNDAYTKCLDCGVITSGSDVKYYGEHNYGTLIPAVPEKHTENVLKAGVDAHYICSICDKYFTEEKTETTLEELTGKTPSHKYGSWINTDYYEHWAECSCGKRVNITEHNYHNSCDTTCDTCGHVRVITHTYSSEWSTDGTKHWRICSVCHNSITDEAEHFGGTATCSEKAKCVICKTEYGKVKGHSPTENTDSKYLVSEATCTEKAIYNKSCFDCGIVMEGTFEFGETEPHDYSTVWTTTGTEHWRKCNNCNDVTEKGEHTGGTATVTEKAKCEICNASYGDLLNNINGWVEEGDHWYFYEKGVKVKNTWREDSTGWCFLDEEGRWVLNSFVKDSTNKWAYITKDGYYYETTGWVEYDGHWYYLEKGYRVENDWRKDSTGWCFLDEEGRWVLNSFVKDSTGKWAYITPDGYYYETTGWIEYDGGWYYLEKGYAVTSQWRKDSIGWCYLSESGRMVTNDFVPDSNGLCYIGGEGYMLEVTDWQLHNDQWYYLEKGYAVTNDWRLDSKGWCYLGEDGAMLTSTWLKDSVGWCYIDENGYCYTNGTYEVDGHSYYFDADGRIEGEPIQE